MFYKLCALIGASILSKAYWNTYRPELITVSYSKAVPIPFALSLHILHLTDIHIEKLSVSPEKIKEMIAGENFDLIALTGDYMGHFKSIEAFLGFADKLSEIKSRYGCFAVWGNHDWVLGQHLPYVKQELTKKGIHVLENEAITFNKQGIPIHLIGIDDHFSGHSHVAKAFKAVPEAGIRIVLSHDPLVVPAMTRSFDYLMSGHFHGGQLYYPLPVHSLAMGILPIKKLLSGLQSSIYGTYYISSGLGQTGLNLRLGCRPEVTIHNLSFTVRKEAPIT